ncbi:MAG: FxsA family protein [bacterium]
MDRDPLLHELVDPDRVLRLLSLGLLGALLMLADGYVLIIVSRQIGIYLLLAAVASTGLFAIVLVIAAYRAEVEQMWRTVRDGRYPRRHFRRLVPLLAAAFLLIVPGFVTDAVGIALVIRPLGWPLGVLVERRNRDRFRELYEYLRLHQ